MSPCSIDVENCYRNKLGPHEGEHRLRHHCEPSQEATFRAPNVVELDEGTRMLPRAETNTVMVRAPTKIENDHQYDESDNGDDLDRGEDELCFTICT